MRVFCGVCSQHEVTSLPLALTFHPSPMDVTFPPVVHGDSSSKVDLETWKKSSQISGSLFLFPFVFDKCTLHNSEAWPGSTNQRTACAHSAFIPHPQKRKRVYILLTLKKNTLYLNCNLTIKSFGFGSAGTYVEFCFLLRYAGHRFTLKNNTFGCGYCQCHCTEVDCSAQCEGGEPVVGRDKANCPTCKGCKAGQMS